jgi:hypothetical protein
LPIRKGKLLWADLWVLSGRDDFEASWSIIKK